MRTYVPFTSPQFVHFRIKEFVDKKLSSVSLFVPPSPWHYEFNMMAAAEWSWNINGRTPEEFARAYAVAKGINEGDFVQWVIKIGQANWDLAASEATSGINFQLWMMALPQLSIFL
jgi:hypothetical protein